MKWHVVVKISPDEGIMQQLQETTLVQTILMYERLNVH